MRLTTHTDYALRVLIQVALREGEQVQIADIAERYRISRHHLTKVVHHLGTGGFLTTQQGRHGGMRLARPADAITVGQVVRALEPDFRLVECFVPETAECRIRSACVLQHAFGDALERFLDHLDGVTIADLVRPRTRLQSLLGIPGTGRTTGA